MSDDLIEHMIPPKDFFRVDEVATILGVHDNTVRRWIEEQSLAHVRVGLHGMIRVPRPALVRLIASSALMQRAQRRRRVIHEGVDLKRFPSR